MIFSCFLRDSDQLQFFQNFVYAIRFCTIYIVLYYSSSYYYFVHYTLYKDKEKEEEGKNKKKEKRKKKKKNIKTQKINRATDKTKKFLTEETHRLIISNANTFLYQMSSWTNCKIQIK